MNLSLFFSKRYFHGMGRSDLEALKSVFGSCGLQFVLELDECDVVPVGDKSNLFEAGKSKQKIRK